MAQPTLTLPADHPFYKTEPGQRLTVARLLWSRSGGQAFDPDATPIKIWGSLVGAGYLHVTGGMAYWTETARMVLANSPKAPDPIAGTPPTASDH